MPENIDLIFGGKMKKGIFFYGLLVSAMFIYAFSNSYALAATYTFDDDEKGWEMGYTDTYYNDKSANWSNTKSPSPGSIYQTVGTSGYKAYSMGLKNVPNPLGNLTGRAMRADVYSSGNWQSGTHARWYIGTSDLKNMYISEYSFSVDLDFSGWQTFTIQMNEDNFFRWPNGSFSTSDSGYLDFDELLSSYDSIGLALYTNDSDDPVFWGNWSNSGSYGAWASSGTAEWGLDNVSSVPIPGAVWLLGSGLIGLVGIRRRFKIK